MFPRGRCALLRRNPHRRRLLRIPPKVLNVGSMDYVADYNGEIHPLEETPLEDNKSLPSYALQGLSMLCRASEEPI